MPCRRINNIKKTGLHSISDPLPWHRMPGNLFSLSLRPLTTLPISFCTKSQSPYRIVCMCVRISTNQKIPSLYVPEERENELAYSQQREGATGFCPQHLVSLQYWTAPAVVAGLSLSWNRERQWCSEMEVWGTGGGTAPTASSHLQGLFMPKSLVLGWLEKEYLEPVWLQCDIQGWQKKNPLFHNGY